MPTMVIALGVGAALGIYRLGGDILRAPWLRWNPVWLTLGTATAVLGGMAAGAALAVGPNPVLVILLALVSLPFWTGPRRVVELVSRVHPRLRFLNLMTWARVVDRVPPGQDLPATWTYDSFMHELDRWPDDRMRPFARLVASRTRDRRSGTVVSPVEDVRREIQAANWIGPGRTDASATRRWQLYVAYWAAIADAALPHRRAALIESLESFREPTTESLLDAVIASIGQPLSSWPWDKIESAGRSIWGDGRSLVNADLDAATLIPETPLPRFVPDLSRGAIPLRPPSPAPRPRMP